MQAFVLDAEYVNLCVYHERECSSSLARIYVLKDLFSGTYAQYTCHQCKVPKCLDACPEGAIVIDSNTGAKTIDVKKIKSVPCIAT